MNTEDRLDKLERGLRRWRLISLSIAVAAGCVFLLAAAPKNPRIVTAEKFVLVDSAGKTVGEWYVRAKGPVLSMSGKDGGTAGIGFADEPQERAMAWLSGPGNRANIKLEAYRDIAFQRVAGGPQGGSVVQIVEADASEIQVSRQGRVRARVRADGRRSWLDVVSPQGSSKLFSNP
jgi:hypothetical protein